MISALVGPRSRARRRLAPAIAAAALAAVPVLARAHGPVHEQIESVTREIERRPADADLHLKRGELYRIEGEWDAAVRDYEHAARLDPGLDQVAFFLGRMLLDADRPGPAKDELDRFLLKSPHNGEALLIRARALARLGDAKAAASDFERALALLPDPGPEPYVELAQALAEAGLADEGLRWLDDGMAKLGPVVTLGLPAIELEVQARRFDAGLRRLDRLAAQSVRQEGWLERRGQILRRAGREQEAMRAFAAALEAIESLPPRQRGVRAVAAQEARLRATLGLSAAASQ